MHTKSPKSLRKKAHKLGLHVTVKHNGKRVPKDRKVLEKQVKRKSKRRKSKRRKSKRKSKRRKSKRKKFNFGWRKSKAQQERLKNEFRQSAVYRKNINAKKLKNIYISQCKKYISHPSPERNKHREKLCNGITNLDIRDACQC